MKLLLRLLARQKGLAILTVLLSVFSIAITLWWNAQLSAMIGAIGSAQGDMGRGLVRACITLLLGAGSAYALSLCSSWTLESVAHDLRMAYARYYAANQVQTLNALLELKALGFTLSEIKPLLQGGMDGDDFAAALTHKRIVWQDAIATAENKMNAIDRIAERMEQTGDAVMLSTLTEEERAWLLVKMVCIEDLRGQSVLSEAIWL